MFLFFPPSFLGLWSMENIRIWSSNNEAECVKKYLTFFELKYTRKNVHDGFGLNR